MAKPLALPASLSILYLALRFSWLAQVSAPRAAWNRVETLGWYLKALLFPYPACFAHDGRALSPWLLLPVLGLPALLYAWRRERFAVFCLLWLPLTLAPFLHLVPFAGDFNPVSDRYLYSASAAFCLLAGDRLQRSPARRALFYVMIAAWGAVTIERNGLYRDPAALYAQTAALAPGNAQAHALLGSYQLTQGEFRAARDSFLRDIVLSPRDASAYENLGAAEFELGELSAARAALQSALEIEPGSARARYDLGLVLAGQGQRPAARARFAQALALDPGYARARAALSAMTPEPGRPAR
jgi:tetratricopeptide (TPR) repeat protein